VVTAEENRVAAAVDTRREVDVVIPVRNGGRLLRRAVASVLDQERVDVRVFVVDDGSTDGAVERLPADPRIVRLENAGRGIPAALNTGIAAGNAPYVARQDADDQSLPGRLASQLDFLEAHDGIGLVATRFDVVVGRRVVATMGPSPAGMLDKNPICAGSTVVRRDVLAEAGNYREAFTLSSDYDAWLRCAWVSGVAVLPAPGYRYRVGASMSTIRRARAQAKFAELAKASARARLEGHADPVGPATAAQPVDLAPDPGDADVAVWWVREFAALGARGDALRCAIEAARALPPRRWTELAAALVRPGPPQGGWK
jgi:hypothetical protein